MNNEIDKLFENDLKNLDISYSIEIGVFSDKDKRNKKKDEKYNNAELLQLHENGSPINNIPARPILDITLQYAKYDNMVGRINDTIIKNVGEKKRGEEDIQRYIEMEAQELVNYARDLIASNEGWLRENTHSTMRQKYKKSIKGGKKAKREAMKNWHPPLGNHPLVDTGQLMNAISYKVVKTK